MQRFANWFQRLSVGRRAAVLAFYGGLLGAVVFGIESGGALLGFALGFLFGLTFFGVIGYATIWAMKVREEREKAGKKPWPRR
jgi:4-hydroxybenzoate polyprenyltransferase